MTRNGLLRLAIATFSISMPAHAETLALLDFVAAAERQSIEARKADSARRQSELERRLLEYKDDAKISASASLGARYTPADRESGATPRRTTTSSGSGTTLEESYALQASRTLYDFGRMEADRARADLQVKTQEQQTEESREALRWKVARAYLKALSAQAILKVTQEQAANAENKRRLTFEGYQQGLRPEFDLARADADLGRARLTLRKAEDEATSALAQLSLFLAPAESSTLPAGFTLKGRLDGREELWKKFRTDWAQPLPSAAGRTREAQRASNEAELKVIDGKFRPTLSGSLSLSMSRSRPLSDEGHDQPYRRSLGGQVTFSWDIPWNGASSEERMRVALKSADIGIQEEAEIRARAEKTRLAKQQMDLIFSQIELNQRQRELVARSLALLRKRYESGKASASELSSAEDEFINVRMENVRLNNAVASALLDLAEAIGVNDLAALFD